MTEDSLGSGSSQEVTGDVGTSGTRARGTQEDPQKRDPGPTFLPGGPLALAILTLLSLLVYWPALDNGFISDDYIFLDRIETWVDNPLYLFQIPPENYRTTTYAAFLILQRLFGYQSEFFYLFTILLHAINAFLLGRLVGVLQENERLGWITALLFVAFQSPQEAILWLGGMHEALQGFGILLTLNLWVRGNAKTAFLCYLLTLFTKESAPILLVLIVLADYWRSRQFSWNRAYLLFLVPTFAFVLTLWLQVTNNSLVEGGFYRPGFHAVPVWLLSAHRLAFPWLYLFALLAAIKNSRKLVDLALPLLWVAVGLAPYIFLTYQDHIPSRHTYVASMGIAAALSILLTALRPRPATVMLLMFLAVNTGYIWVRKDAQYEERAAPTRELTQKMRVTPVRPIVISHFPMNPWIAKMTARTVPGWEPHYLVLPDLDPECVDCPVWEWDPQTRSYR